MIGFSVGFWVLIMEGKDLLATFHVFNVCQESLWIHGSMCKKPFFGYMIRQIIEGDAPMGVTQ